MRTSLPLEGQYHLVMVAFFFFGVIGGRIGLFTLVLVLILALLLVRVLLVGFFGVQVVFGGLDTLDILGGGGGFPGTDALERGISRAMDRLSLADPDRRVLRA